MHFTFDLIEGEGVNVIVKTKLQNLLKKTNKQKTHPLTRTSLRHWSTQPGTLRQRHPGTQPPPFSLVWSFNVKKRSYDNPVTKIRHLGAVETSVLCRRLLGAFLLICRLLSASSLKIRLLFIATPTRGSLAVQVRLAAQMYHTVKQELHCGLTGLDVLGQS